MELKGERITIALKVGGCLFEAMGVHDNPP